MSRLPFASALARAIALWSTLVLALLTTGCADQLPLPRGDGAAATETAAPTPSPTRAAIMPIYTPTPVVPGALDPGAGQGAPTRVPENPATYTVVEGDSLYAIALRFGVELQALIELNGLSNPNDIRVGQELQIPSRP
jgi:LysM repeat protein